MFPIPTGHSSGTMLGTATETKATPLPPSSLYMKEGRSSATETETETETETMTETQATPLPFSLYKRRSSVPLSPPLTSSYSCP